MILSCVKLTWNWSAIQCSQQSPSTSGFSLANYFCKRRNNPPINKMTWVSCRTYRRLDEFIYKGNLQKTAGNTAVAIKTSELLGQYSVVHGYFFLLWYVHNRKNAILKKISESRNMILKIVQKTYVIHFQNKLIFHLTSFSSFLCKNSWNEKSHVDQVYLQ